jgi:hypothetical protein
MINNIIYTTNSWKIKYFIQNLLANSVFTRQIPLSLDCDCNCDGEDDWLRWWLIEYDVWSVSPFRTLKIAPTPLDFRFFWNLTLNNYLIFIYIYFVALVTKTSVFISQTTKLCFRCVGHESYWWPRFRRFRDESYWWPRCAC